jgi:hypothetical protein
MLLDVYGMAIDANIEISNIGEEFLNEGMTIVLNTRLC